jgi:hypothetical protein
VKSESTRQFVKRPLAAYGFGFLTAVLFLFVGIITLPGYGYTWDSPENLLTGEHYAHFFQTGESQWLDFAYWDEVYLNAGAERPLLHNRQFNAPFRYPPVANVIAVLSHQLFSNELGWLADPDGYHLSILLFATLTVFVMAVFTWQAFGPIASLAATLALITYPLFFEHAHNNLKDVPFAALILLALWSYWSGVRHGRWFWFIISAIATGFALGIRILSLEVYLIIGIVYLPTIWVNRREGIKALRPYKPLLVHIPLALLIFLLLWPWLWPDPVGRLSQHLAFGRDVSRGLRILYAGQIWDSGLTLPWHYTAVIFSLTTPLLVLVGGFLGGLAAAKRSFKQQDVAALMLLTLFALSLLRTSWPTVPQYDGTRHMMDGLVAFMGLFGLGFQVSWQWLNQRWPRPLPLYLPLVLLTLAFLPIIFRDIQLHPYQGIYYNSLAGGPAGAFDNYPQEYWGSSFRLGAEWLIENSDPATAVLPRVGGHLLRNYLPTSWQIIPDEAIPTLPPEQQITLIYMTRRDKYDWIAEYADKNLTQIFQLQRAGVPVLKIVETDAGTLQQRIEK